MWRCRGRVPPLPEALLWVTRPKYIMLTALLFLSVVVHNLPSTQYIFLLYEGQPALGKSGDIADGTVTRGWTIPASNPSNSKRPFSSRLTPPFSLPPYSHWPLERLQGQFYFYIWFGKFLLIFFYTCVNSTIGMHHFVTRVFWFPVFSKLFPRYNLEYLI